MLPPPFKPHALKIRFLHKLRPFLIPPCLREGLFNGYLEFVAIAVDFDVEFSGLVTDRIGEYMRPTVPWVVLWGIPCFESGFSERSGGCSALEG